MRMNQILKIIILVVGIIALDMILLNIFHLDDYLITAISVGIAILAATHESQRKK
jgi:hypothetical protein